MLLQARDAIKHLLMQRTAPHNKELSGPECQSLRNPVLNRRILSPNLPPQFTIIVRKLQKCANISRKTLPFFFLKQMGQYNLNSFSTFLTFDKKTTEVYVLMMSIFYVFKGGFMFLFIFSMLTFLFSFQFLTCHGLQTCWHFCFCFSVVMFQFIL